MEKTAIETAFVLTLQANQISLSLERQVVFLPAGGGSFLPVHISAVKEISYLEEDDFSSIMITLHYVFFRSSMNCSPTRRMRNSSLLN